MKFGLVMQWHLFPETNSKCARQKRVEFHGMNNTMGLMFRGNQRFVFRISVKKNCIVGDVL